MQKSGVCLWLLLAVAGGCKSGGPHELPPDSLDGAVDGPGALSWRRAAPCPLPRFESSGAVVGGELWVMGGFVSSGLEVTRRVDIYDPSTDIWRPGPELPAAQTHLAVVVVDRDVVLIGGFEGKGNAWATTAAVWRWRAEEAAWTMGPALPTAGAAAAAALVGTEVHVAGGLAADGKTDTGKHLVWHLEGEPTWTEGPPLPDARNHGGGTASGGLFYAVAGRHGWDEVSGHAASVHAFDRLTDTWTARAPIPFERSEIGASTSTLADGRLLVIGGSITGMRPTATVVVYDPVQNGWSPLSSLPERRKGAVAAAIGTSLIVTTGSPTSLDPSDTTFVGCCL